MLCGPVFNPENLVAVGKTELSTHGFLPVALHCLTGHGRGTRRHAPQWIAHTLQDVAFRAPKKGYLVAVDRIELSTYGL
jgi:hypothetical protein